MANDKFLFVVSGAAGTGKDSVVKALREAHPEIEKTVSATTRTPRPGEQEGVDYYYRTREQFQQLLENDQVVEHNFYNGNYYGTLKSEVEKRLEAGKVVVLVIDVHGAANIRRMFPGATTVFLLPPSVEELELEDPEIVRQGGRYGVRMKASAPSIHMLRADVSTTVSPIVGNEKQSQDMVNYLLQEFEGEPGKLWESNIFGRSFHEIVGEDLQAKLKRMPEDSQKKLREALERILNEGSGGLICIIL